MKPTKIITVATLLTAFLAAPLASFAAEAKPDAKAKPYPLDTCVVSDEKLGEDPDMKPFAFTYKGQEVKLCCKSCKKEFDKEPAKYLGKIDKAEKDKK